MCRSTGANIAPLVDGDRGIAAAMPYCGRGGRLSAGGELFKGRAALPRRPDQKTGVAAATPYRDGEVLAPGQAARAANGDAGRQPALRVEL